MSARSVAIIGGGLSGLTAAFELTRAGISATVFEAAERCGGVLAPVSLTANGHTVTVDAGAEAMLNRRPEGVELAQAAGLGDDLVYPATTHAQIFSQGALHPMPTGTVMGVPTAQTDLKGLFSDSEIAEVRAAMATPHDGLSADQSVAEFITSRCGQAVTDRLVEPLLSGVYAGQCTALSVQAALPMVWSAATQGGALADALTPTSAGTAAGTTQVPVFAGIHGGVYRLADALVSAIQDATGTIHTNTPVTGLRRDHHTWVVTTAHGEHHADDVIVALQPDRAATLLASVAPQAATTLGSIPMASMALVSMVVPTADLPPLHYSGVLVPPAEGLTVKAITNSSTKWAWVRDLTPDHTILRASLGRHHDDSILADNDTDVVHTALTDMHHILGHPVQPIAHHVTRWRGALPQYNVGHSTRIQDLTHAIDTIDGLHYTGSVLHGVGIPACIASAQKVCATITTKH